MRVWDRISPGIMCRQHLLGEHREIHSLWTILRRVREGERPGYTRHPETQRWKDNVEALAVRHQLLVIEMRARNYNHQSPLLSDDVFIHSTDQNITWPEPLDDQMKVLRAKGCNCKTE